MNQRVPRYPPRHARMIKLESGPPMYRMLGYADKNNLLSDLCAPCPPPGWAGPFSWPKCIDQQTKFGPGRFGLPSMPLAYTTSFYDDRAISCDVLCNRRGGHKMSDKYSWNTPSERPEAVTFPEMAVPGTGLHSRFKNSGYICDDSLPPLYRSRQVGA